MHLLPVYHSSPPGGLLDVQKYLIDKAILTYTKPCGLVTFKHWFERMDFYTKIARINGQQLQLILSSLCNDCYSHALDTLRQLLLCFSRKSSMNSHDYASINIFAWMYIYLYQTY